MLQVVTILTLMNIKEQDFSLLHLNISSLSAHINELKAFLSQVDTKFGIICISKSRISKKNSLTTNIDILGYNIEQTPTESTPGGSLCIYHKRYHTGYEKTYRYITLRSWNQFSLSFLFLVNQA